MRIDLHPQPRFDWGQVPLAFLGFAAGLLAILMAHG